MEDQPDKRWRPTPARPVEIEFVDPALSADALVARRAILSTQLADLAESIASIRTQLESSEAAEVTLGKYPDTEWVRRVHKAARHFGRQHGEHARAIENLSRRIVYLENTEVSRERAFVEAARKLLPVESLRQIWARVEAGDDRGFIGVTGVELRGQADA
jgi:hypothetical protein